MYPHLVALVLAAWPVQASSTTTDSVNLSLTAKSSRRQRAELATPPVERGVSDGELMPRVSRDPAGDIQIDARAVIEHTRDELRKPDALREIRARGIQGDPSQAQIRVIIDSQFSYNLQPGQELLQVNIGKPTAQRNIVMEWILDGKVIHRTDPAMLETKLAQEIDSASFAADAPFTVTLPENATSHWGFKGDVARQTAEYRKKSQVYIVLDPDLDRRISQLGEGYHVEYERSPETWTFRSQDGGKSFKLDTSGTPWEKKPIVRVGDADFNGDTFDWDGKAVSMFDCWFDPELCKSTLNLWDKIQKQAGGGIPREVLKSNLITYNPLDKVKFGRVIPNGDYANPYLRNWVEEELYALSSPAAGKERLRGTIRSIDDFDEWVDKNRTVIGPDGKRIEGCYWQSNLGSGMDNSPRCGTNGHPELFPHCCWVDMLAQRIWRRKSAARMYAALGEWDGMRKSSQEADELEKILNTRFWDPKNGMYFDQRVKPDGRLAQDPTPTIAGIVWPLASQSVKPAQFETMHAKQLIPGRFGGSLPFNAVSEEMANPERNHQLRTQAIELFNSGVLERAFGVKPKSLREAEQMLFDGGAYWKYRGGWPVLLAVGNQGLESLDHGNIAFDYAKRWLARMTEASQGLGHFEPAEFYGIQREPGGTERGIFGVEIGDNKHVHKTRHPFVGWGGDPALLNLPKDIVGLRPVPGFAGNPPELDSWLKAVENDELFRGTRFAPLKPLHSMTPEQKKLVAEGYMEVNLRFDPGDAPLELGPFHYQGAQVRKLRIEKVAERGFKVTVESDKPVNLVVNQQYDSTGRAVARPVAMGMIRKIGGTQPETIYELQ